MFAKNETPYSIMEKICYLLCLLVFDIVICKQIKEKYREKKVPNPLRQVLACREIKRKAPSKKKKTKTHNNSNINIRVKSKKSNVVYNK